MPQLVLTVLDVPVTTNLSHPVTGPKEKKIEGYLVGLQKKQSGLPNQQWKFTTEANMYAAVSIRWLRMCILLIVLLLLLLLAFFMSPYPPPSLCVCLFSVFESCYLQLTCDINQFTVSSWIVADLSWCQEWQRGHATVKWKWGWYTLAVGTTPLYSCLS